MPECRHTNPLQRGEHDFKEYEVPPTSLRHLLRARQLSQDVSSGGLYFKDDQ